MVLVLMCFLSLLPIDFQHQDNIKVKKGSLDLHYSFLPKRNRIPLDLHYPCLSKRNTQNRAGVGVGCKTFGIEHKWKLNACFILKTEKLINRLVF